MKPLFFAILLAVTSTAARAQYQQIDLTVFGMDCAPCAHAIHVSMKGIQGVDKVDVDLNTGLVRVNLTPGSTASIRQFNEAVEKNGFTHKDATVQATGRLTGTLAAPFFEVSGTSDRFALVPSGATANLTTLLGKSVTVHGVLPQAAKGKIADSLHYSSIVEAR